MATLAWAGGIAAWLGLALFLYQPHIARPFDVVDFPEFVPLLEQASSPWDAFGQIVSYYARHGRFNVLDYALLAAKWQVFGHSTIAWQVTGAVIMTGMAGVLLMLLRWLGASMLGAGLTSTLVLCSQLAGPAWIRLSIRESLGSVMLYGGMLAAMKLHSSRRWKWLLVTCALVAVGVTLLKEMLVVALPGLWFIGAASSAQPLRTALWSQRSLWLALVLLGTSVLALIPVVIVALRASPDAFAAAYGTAMVTPGELLLAWLALLIPFTPVTGQPNIAVFVTDLAFVSLLVIGWRSFLVAHEDKQRGLVLLAFALTFPWLCVIAYMPWPMFRLFHGLPFILGTAILVAFAVTGIQRTRSGWTWIPVTAWLWITIYMATHAHAFAREYDASVRVLRQTVHALEATATQDSVLYAFCGGLSVDHWRGVAPLLERMAAAENRRHAPLVATTCAELQGRVAEGSPGVAYLALSRGRFSIGVQSHRVIQSMRRLDWNRFRIVEDSMRAELIVSNPSRDAR